MKNRLTFLILLISGTSFSQKNLEEITKEKFKHFTHFTKQLDTQHSLVNPTMNIINFYKVLFNEVSNINLNMDDVLNTYLKTTKDLEPSEKSSERIKDIHNYLCDLDKEGIQDLSQNVSYMNDSTLFESIQNIEKLYMKLMIEYSYELQRSQALGIFSKGQEES